MPRSTASTVENNFINGLITQATALNFPEAAATDTQNCIFNLDGSFERRKGIDFETGYAETTQDRTASTTNTFVWYSAAGSGNYNFVVVQVGLTLYFYQITNTPLSSSRLSGTIDVSSFLASGYPSNAASIDCGFASGKGYLFVVHPFCDPFYVAYNGTTVSATRITIQIRDLKGLDDGLAIDQRPNTLSDTHKYNLWNQGWNPYDSGGLTSPLLGGLSTPTVPSGYVVGNNLATWDAVRADFPSNADVWWLFKDANEVFQPTMASNVTRGNSPSPKGHYILNAFNKDRSTAVATTVTVNNTSTSFSIPGISVETSSYFRPKAIAFFAGRVFYAGVDYDGFGNTIYFSQQMSGEGVDKFGKCYQLNDPTSENTFDLLPTDGGTIQILDCGSVYKMYSMGTILLIFASNGIWAISGSSGLGFTASDFSVTKVSTLPTLSASSFVDMAGTPVWWTLDGIYTIGQASQLNGTSITSLTEKRIKSFFLNSIPQEAKRYARGFFNPLTKVIQWAYRSTPSVSLSSLNEYDTILNYNTITSAFYPWYTGTGTVTLNAIISAREYNVSSTSAAVTVSGTNVTVAGAVVNQTAYTNNELADQFKYLVSYWTGSTHKLTFADERKTTYLDFETKVSGGQDYPSYLVTGYKIRGDAQRRFQTNYIVLYSDMSVAGVYDFGAIWDYSTDVSNGDWSSIQRVDTTTVLGRKYKFRRLKVRGMGLALQFKLASVSGYPFKIVGWSTFDSGNNVP